MIIIISDLSIKKIPINIVVLQSLYSFSIYIELILVLIFKLYYMFSDNFIILDIFLYLIFLLLYFFEI